MEYEIIDFHTHPFILDSENICAHKNCANMGKEFTLELFNALNVKTFCGSVLSSRSSKETSVLEIITKNNQTALELKRFYGDRYYPGFHVHPAYVDYSISVIDNMVKNGFKLIGELVPYFHSWSSYAEQGLNAILDYAGDKGVIVNFHTQDHENAIKMVKNHKNVIFVGAHPGEKPDIEYHLRLAKECENYYIDLSGYGVHRFGAIKTIVNGFGINRVLYGSDYPTCSPATFIGAITGETLLTSSEKQAILYKNAKTLLNI
ncbi:MAG: amidohydrolase family protein [Clostridia bacterium]|nr:amidohydrolase family protein [Clostridia bacterium]